MRQVIVDEGEADGLTGDEREIIEKQQLPSCGRTDQAPDEVSLA
jgi:hypothetical protein